MTARLSPVNIDLRDGEMLDDRDGSSPPARRPDVRTVLAAVLVGLTVAAIGAAVVLTRPPVYVAKAALLFDQPAALAASDDEGVIRKLDLVRHKYVDLVRTPVIAKPVADRLGFDPGAVQAASSAYAGPLSLALFTVARTDDPARARAVAQGLADEIVSYVEREQEAEGIEPGRRIEVRVVEPAGGAVKESPTTRRALEVAVTGGAMAAAVVYAALHLAAGRAPGGVAGGRSAP